MTDIVDYVQERSDELGDYNYLQQFEPDAEGMQFNEEIPFDRMREIYELEQVWGGISGERQMRKFLNTDLLDGNVTKDHFTRGLTRDELNDLQNYIAWNTYDTLALRATEGESEIIPRQEYEFLSTIYATLRWPEVFKALIATVGLEGIMESAEVTRQELGTGLVGLGGWATVVPGFGTIGLDILDQLNPADPLHLPQRKTYMTVGTAISYALRGGDGYISQSQNRYIHDIKNNDVIEFVQNHLVEFDDSTKATFRQFNAAAELLAFLMHYDNRVGLLDNGPYLIEDGKPMILRDAFLNRPFLPWNDIAAKRDLPNCATIALVIDPEELGLQEIRCSGTTFTAPSNYLSSIERGAVFLRDEPEGVEPLPLNKLKVADIDAELPDLTDRANEAVSEWYERTAKLSRREKIMNGAHTYYFGMLVPLLRKTGSYEYFVEELDLRELPPMVSEMYYMMMDDVAAEEIPAQIMFGYGWEDFPEQSTDESGYADYLNEAREMNWKSDLSGMNEVPEYWAERMDEHNLLDVNYTKMEGEIDRSELCQFLDGL